MLQPPAASQERVSPLGASEPPCAIVRRLGVQETSVVPWSSASDRSRTDAVPLSSRSTSATKYVRPGWKHWRTSASVDAAYVLGVVEAAGRQLVDWTEVPCCLRRRSPAQGEAVLPAGGLGIDGAIRRRVHNMRPGMLRPYHGHKQTAKGWRPNGADPCGQKNRENAELRPRAHTHLFMATQLPRAKIARLRSGPSGIARGCAHVPPTHPRRRTGGRCRCPQRHAKPNASLTLLRLWHAIGARSYLLALIKVVGPSSRARGSSLCISE